MTFKVPFSVTFQIIGAAFENLPKTYFLHFYYILNNTSIEKYIKCHISPPKDDI